MLKSKHGNAKYTVADIERQAGLEPTPQNRQEKQGPERQGPATPHPEDNAVPEQLILDTDGDQDFEMSDVVSEVQIESISNYLAEQRMAVDPISPQSYTIPQSMLSEQDVSTDKTVFVVDTNFLISHLNTLEELRKLAGQFNHIIVAPITTVRELDGLKLASDKSIAKLARHANEWLFKNLGDRSSGLVGQRLKERINPSASKDDAILDCCLYLQQKLNHKLVILLSNDKNLCAKALSEGMLTVSYRPGMTAQLISQMAYSESISLGNATPSPQFSKLDFHEVANKIFNDIQAMVITIVDHIMNKSYGEDIIAINYDPKNMKDLNDVARVISKFWLSVFSDYFDRNSMRKEDWKELPSQMVTVPNSSSDLNTFLGFWEGILIKLNRDLGENDQHVVQAAIAEWKQYIDLV
ncbi:PIN domain [Nakaseomyces glabratus]|nr:PIN domain [Nakaseomyces glabratus]KAH7595023.1 PIN domain [Nakaseomyces glabratus]KAH7611107.1 PIN domain [Nakaseomyces glabratus]